MCDYPLVVVERAEVKLVATLTAPPLDSVPELAVPRP
jgi:hypothetical protein